MDPYTHLLFGRMISLPFLVLTFLHYRLTSNLGVLYKKCFMNYLVLLMFTNLCLIFMVTKNHGYLLNLIGYIYSFVSMSTLLWTNVLCYDFWQRIKNLMPYNDERGESRMFIKCSIYVWSCSFLYLTVIFINTNLFRSHQKQMPINLTLFIIHCVILLSNFLMILHATLLIIKGTQSIKNLKGADTFNPENDHKQKLRLYFKLIVGTILLVTCNSLFWLQLITLLDQYLVGNSKLRNYLVSLGRCALIVNSYQGVYFFVIFTFKKKYILALKKKVSDLLCKQTIHTDTHLSKHEDT